MGQYEAAAAAHSAAVMWAWTTSAPPPALMSPCSTFGTVCPGIHVTGVSQRRTHLVGAAADDDDRMPLLGLRPGEHRHMPLHAGEPVGPDDVKHPKAAAHSRSPSRIRRAAGTAEPPPAKSASRRRLWRPATAQICRRAGSGVCLLRWRARPWRRSCRWSRRSPPAHIPPEWPPPGPRRRAPPGPPARRTRRHWAGRTRPLPGGRAGVCLPAEQVHALRGTGLCGAPVRVVDHVRVPPTTIRWRSASSRSASIT